MNKTITRFKKVTKIFGIKIAETNEQYESVNLENVDPLSSLIVSEYEIEELKQKKSEE